MRASARLAVALLAVLVATGLPACSHRPALKQHADSSFPVSIRHEYGTTVIKHRPTRVVSIGYHEQDILLALGIRPVAYQAWLTKKGIEPWAEPRLGDAKPTVFAPDAELDLEKIAKLRPDLIVGTYRDVSDNEYRLLSKIAPTLLRPTKYSDYAVPYAVETHLIGKAVGKPHRAAALVTKTRHKFAEVRKTHPEFGGNTAVMALPMQGGGLAVYSSSDPRGQFLRGLGFTIPKRIDRLADGEYYVELSPERLDLIGHVDLLIVLDKHLPDSFFDHNQLYQHLNVVKQEHAIYPFKYTDAASFNTILSIPHAINNATPQLAKTLR